MTVIVDQSGRIELPDEMRARLGIRPGDELIFVERSGEWVLRRVNTQQGLVKEGDVLVHRGTMTTSATIGELREQVANERMEGLSDGLRR